MGTCAELEPSDRADSQSICVPQRGNATETPFTECVHRWFESQAEMAPDAVALRFEDRTWTYRELNSRATQIARWLRNRGVGPDSIVALRIQRSLEMIAGILGILKAGGAYLPIDPSYPVGRQEFMLRDANARWLLTHSQLPPLSVNNGVVRLDLDDERPASEPGKNPDGSVRPENLAYVIYTSGSSGKPKGVMVTHGNLAHSTAARFRQYAGPVDNFLLLSSCAFDSSVAGIFWTLCGGGTLTLPREFSQQTSSEPADLIARHRVSHLLCLPSLYSVLLEQSASLGSLQVVIVAGESCPATLVRQHHERLPRATLYNEYGPTEATVWSTVHLCTPQPGAQGVSIGRPIPGVEIHLLDENLRPVPAGDAGELHIGGVGVARGYLHQPGLTAEKFIADPFGREPSARLYKTGDLARYLPDGSLEFLGRLDHQIKIRGHRVELEEIESALKQHEAVQNAIVAAREMPRATAANAAAESLEGRLSELDPAEAEALLSEVERERGGWDGEPRAHLSAAGNGHTERQARRFPEFEVALDLKRGDFIRPPRASQRSWLVKRALDEFADDLLALDSLARRFVPGVETGVETLTLDRTQAVLSEQEILEDWHIPLMQAMARAVAENRGDILEIGFGRGMSATAVQEQGVRSHTIIECNDSVIARFFEPWRKRFPDRDIQLVRGKWQDVIGELGRFDGILFQTYPLNEREFAEYLARSVTFAEHFFPTAARHLNRGGVFTYLTHEIDSLSRRHQRLIFQHFSSVTLSVERLRLPADCKDLWWADSMVAARAIK